MYLILSSTTSKMLTSIYYSVLRSALEDGINILKFGVACLPKEDSLPEIRLLKYKLFPLYRGLRATYDHSQIHKLNHCRKNGRLHIKYFYNSAWVWKQAHTYSLHKRVSFWRRSCQLAVPTRLIYNSATSTAVAQGCTQDSKYLLRDESFQRLFTWLFWITLHPFAEHKSTPVCDLGKGAFSRGMAWQRQESKPAGLQDPGGGRMVLAYWLLCF